MVIKGNVPLPSHSFVTDSQQQMHVRQRAQREQRFGLGHFLLNVINPRLIA